MGKGIPERWETYTNIGQPIPGTRLFAFKVPLKDASLQNLPMSIDPFGPRDLIDNCPNLGLVIDLTNTTRYYNPDEFLNEDIEYEKIKTEGHVIPKPHIVKRFFEVIDKFLNENPHNDKLIGVHCTHGVNRTGYLICRYMIQQLGIPPNRAISDFNWARGHKLERQNYLDNLRRTPMPRGGPPFPSTRGLGFRTHPSSSRDNGRATSFEGYFSPPFVPRFDNSSEGPPPRRMSRFNSPSERVAPTDMPRFNNFSGRGTIPQMSSFNNYSDGPTPYMPQQSRGMMRGGSHSSVRPRFSRSPVGRTPSFSTNPSPFREGMPDVLAGPRLPLNPFRSGRGGNPNFSNSRNWNDEETMDGENFKSPVFGNMRNQFNKGQVSPQCNDNFYSRGGGGGSGGPHRPNQKNIPRPRQDQHPGNYRGPSRYGSPNRIEESFQEQQRFDQNPSSPYRSSKRSRFSPDIHDDDDDDDDDDVVFISENEGSRNRYSRFQPY